MLLWKGVVLGGAVTGAWALLGWLAGPPVAANYLHVFIAAAAGAMGAAWAEYALPKPKNC